MAILDLSTPTGLLRIRVGDTRDLQLLSDEVYEQALTEANGNLKKATRICAMYILGQLAFKSQQSLNTLTVYGNQQFSQYRQYVEMLLKDPNISDISPLPYSGTGEPSPIVRFTKNWDKELCFDEWIKPL
jgi:hypothetical protein